MALLRPRSDTSGSALLQYTLPRPRLALSSFFFEKPAWLK